MNNLFVRLLCQTIHGKNYIQQLIIEYLIIDIFFNY
jgi:hypothetical protein